MECFEFDLFNGFSEDDVSFLKLQLARRHLLIHNSGVVDKKYLCDTNDDSVRLGQLIRVSREDIIKTSSLLRRVLSNLY